MIDAIGKLPRKVLAESLLAFAQIRVRSRVLLSPGLCLVRAPTYPNARRADSRALQAYRRGKSRGRSKLARGVPRCPNILADAPAPWRPAQSCSSLQSARAELLTPWFSSSSPDQRTTPGPELRSDHSVRRTQLPAATMK